MTFQEKKVEFIETLKKYNAQELDEVETLKKMTILASEDELRTKELIQIILKECQTYLPQLSQKEIKQRILMLESLE